MPHEAFIVSGLLDRVSLNANFPKCLTALVLKDNEWRPSRNSGTDLLLCPWLGGLRGSDDALPMRFPPSSYPIQTRGAGYPMKPVRPAIRDGIELRRQHYRMRSTRVVWDAATNGSDNLVSNTTASSERHMC